MDFRKVIKFGENSYVISLPNKWVRENKIKKGDLISLEQEKSLIKISPHEIKKEVHNTEINLDYSKIKNFKNLKQHITASYMNGYDQIIVTGKELAKDTQKIRELSRNFVGLEIIEQTPQRIVLKEFLNLQEASYTEITRRIDRIVISMLEDTEKHFNGEKNILETLKQKDSDISRLNYFSIRLTNSIIKNKIRRDIKYEEILYYTEMINYLEKFANQIKRIPRYIGKAPNSVQEVFKKISNMYKETMRANYLSDPAAVIELMNKREDLYSECEKLIKYIPKKSYGLIEKMKNAIEKNAQFSKAILKYKYGI